MFLSLPPIGEQMVGPAIRAYELARAVSSVADVVLAGQGEVGEFDFGFPTATYDRHDPAPLRPLLDQADVVVSQPQWPLMMRALRRSGARLVFDLCAPDPFETVEHLTGSARPIRALATSLSLDRFLDALRWANHLLCATETQRGLWLGTMLGDRMIDQSSYDRDPSYDSVISVVPFGLPDDPPRATGNGIRRRFGKIGPDDEVILWNGGLWNWLDPGTAIRAVGLLAERRPQVRLVFISSERASRAKVNEVRTLSDELGLTDRIVFFNDRWIPYDQRANWLLETACLLNCYERHLETRFAARTRTLDSFWAGVPMVCTRGDELAAEIERNDLGAVVPESNPAATADALETVLSKDKNTYAERLRKTAERYRWSVVAEPLVDAIAAGIGESTVGGVRPRRPGHMLRAAAYCGLRYPLNALGIKGWPYSPLPR